MGGLGAPGVTEGFVSGAFAPTLVMVCAFTNSKRSPVLLRSRCSASAAVSDPFTSGLRRRATSSEANIT